jgi:hypothetical protein
VDLHEYEKVDSDTGRIRVPGGWLYQTWHEQSVATTFVPDPQTVEGEVGE